MAQQASTLSHSSNVFYNPWATELAELLISLTRREGGLGYAPGSTPLSPGAKVFFANSGTEANEGALKVARKIGKERGWAASSQGGKGKKGEKLGGAGAGDPSSTKFRVACFENAFHGRSFGSLSATSNQKYQAPFAPMVPGFDVGKVNDVGALERLITEDTCAVIVEPIQGEGGIFVVDEGWLRAVRTRCNEVGAVLIFDEIQVSEASESTILFCFSLKKFKRA
jgi:acetylornithine aminotransferase